jgi:hypothetical protein
MISDFLVQHPSGPFFELSEDEWKQATAKHKSLSADTDLNYVARTATASINIGSDAYFDNETILNQFERLFQMLKFKQEYKNNQIEIIVDNARTHSTKLYSLKEFGKNIGTRCPVKQIEYIDENGASKVIDSYFKHGEHKNKSKGLLELSRELGFQFTDKTKLDVIIEELSKHRAFQNVSESRSIFLKMYYVFYHLSFYLGYKT